MSSEIKIRYNPDRWPLAPLMDKLSGIMDKCSLEDLECRTGLTPKTLKNILGGKHVPYIGQFRGLLEALELECILTQESSEPIPFILEHKSILAFITRECDAQAITPEQLESKAQLIFRTLHNMKKNVQAYNLETLVRILKALGYSLDVRPLNENVKATQPQYSYSGVHVDHTHDPDNPLTKILDKK